MGCSVTVSAIFLLVPSYSLLSYSFELPNDEIFFNLNQKLELKLSDLANAVTQADFAENLYRSDPNVILEKVDGRAVLESVLEEMRKFLQQKQSAVRRLVDKAEEKFAKFQAANGSLSNVENLSFLNMKALNPAPKFTFDLHFRQKISFQESGAHIPLDILDGYAEVLNGLNWTAGIDDAFKENWKNDPALGWQYFGSYHGFMRVYPAFRWPDHPSLPDLFDVRRRSWYIQASVTPKDVIMLIDRSGSVHGPTLDIIKITARALLNSLGENDYVNVAWFNNKVRWIVPCLNTLVQAKAQVRRLLGDAVDRLTESNRTSYAIALDFAFEAFRKFDESKKPWTGSNCHKIIMFLSDGGTDWPSELVTKHCNESRNGRIKIFTFACGPHPIPTVVLKEMACATGGYFSPITALGSVRVKIQDYVKVLSRPLALSEDEDLYQWHTPYRDVGGLGMVTSVTLPVFNKSAKKGSFDRLLGVMGVDIPVQALIDLFPKHLLGSFGYAFAINTNGFVLFHPRLHDHVVYIEDPPNIYLTDLEGTTEEVRRMERKMIDGSYGSLLGYQSIVPVGLGHAISVPMDYFFGPAEPSTFRFGVAMPSNLTTFKVRPPHLDVLASFLVTTEGLLLAPWHFCSSADELGDFTPETLAERILDNYTSCDEDLVNHLLWDLEKVKLLRTHWEDVNAPETRSRFVITSGGLTAHLSRSEREYKRQGDPHKNNLFKRASNAAGFVFSMEKGAGPVATVARKIVLKDSAVAAVTGAEIEQDAIQKVFEEATKHEHQSCGFPEVLHCYLLNDGGMIVASNREASKAGDFVGLHDPELLDALLSGNLFKLEHRYNYQSWCSKNTEYVQALATATAFHWSILKFLYELIITSFQWNFLHTTLLHLLSSVSAWKRIDHSDHSLETGNQSCVTKSAWYYHSGLISHSGAVNCGNHDRNFRAKFLPNVSLVFVMAQPHCYDPQSYVPVPLAFEQDAEPQHCAEEQHYRLRPGKCYSKAPKNVFADCGDASHARATRATVAALVAEATFFLAAALTP